MCDNMYTYLLVALACLTVAVEAAVTRLSNPSYIRCNNSDPTCFNDMPSLEPVWQSYYPYALQVLQITGMMDQHFAHQMVSTCET
jgi:hypothetical protein